jgi:hypothetical protein
MSKHTLTVALTLALSGTPIHGTAQSGGPAYWPPGPVGYGPCWQQPCYGYPYPCPQTPSPRALTPRGHGLSGPSAAPREGAEVPRLRPTVPRQAPPAPTPGSSLPSLTQPGTGYRYQGGVIEAPEGPAYHAFGTLPGLGTPYQRYGNVLYGPGSRCQLFGNTAFCW